MGILYARVASMWEARSWEERLPEQVQMTHASADKLELLFSDFAGIRARVLLQIAVQDDGFSFTAHVSNDDSGVVVGVIMPCLDGMTDAGEGTLYYPDRAGAKIAKPFAALREAAFGRSYPVPLSAQFLTYNTGTDGWLLACHDTAMSYKELLMGGPERQIRITQFPFVEAGKSATLAPVVLQGYAGDWHIAADRYRAWFDSWRSPPVSQALSHFPVFGSVVIRARPVEDAYLQDVSKDMEVGTYAAAIPALQRLRAKGIDGVHIVGWHGQGHDTDYPEFRIPDDFGGREGLRAMADSAHAMGLIPGYYTNGRLANTRNPLFLAHPEWLVRLPEGSQVREHYGAECFDVLCPHAAGFIAHLEEIVSDLATNFRAAFIQIDQVGAAAGLLCFDPRHGHRTPATAWVEGYARMLKRLLAAAHRVNPDFWIWTEGNWDFSGQHVALQQGGFWQDHAGMQPFPQLFRYTFPDDLMMGDVMNGGVPFWVKDAQEPAVRFVTAHRDFFARSRFMDNVGLSVDKPQVEARWHLADDAAIIAVRNPGERAARVTVRLEVAEWLSDPQIIGGTRLSDGVRCPLEREGTAIRMPLELPAGGIDGVVVAWEAGDMTKEKKEGAQQENAPDKK